MTCRSIQDKAQWDLAYEVLLSYFSWRHGFSNAADLAHDTIAALLASDFEFEKPEDFPKVYRAFARIISMATFREAARRTPQQIDTETMAAPSRDAFGLNPTEMKIYAEEVIRTGRSELRTIEWKAIEQSIALDRSIVGDNLGLGNANNARVFLYRARRKLMKLTGWKKTRL